MKQILKYFPLVLIWLSAACGRKTAAAPEEEATPKTPVEVVTVSDGNINDELTLFATTMYQKRNMVTATIPGFITQVNIKLGDRVKKGEVLYILQSKESRALGNAVSKIDSSLKDFGIIKITASASGVVTTFDKQLPGDYVLEGGQLCTIAENSDLVFNVNVPYEFTRYAKVGNYCTIIFPDNTRHSAKFIKALTAMNIGAQTQSILARSNENLFLPENMMVKVVVQKDNSSQKQVLPKSCVMSDEMMKAFWIMKLINDSTAVKVPVTIGNKNSESIEILSPQFDNADQIISIGNYGLPDTALVYIITPEKK